MTKIYENSRIKVTLTDEQSLKFDHDRALILSNAMRILGNQSELHIIEGETPTQSEIETAATKQLMYTHLAEHHRYNLAETIMRLNGGHRMPKGMAADVESARMYAQHELIENLEHANTIGRRAIQLETDNELKYRSRFANNSWDIQVIGEMPEQIGMCRYDE